MNRRLLMVLALLAALVAISAPTAAGVQEGAAEPKPERPAAQDESPADDASDRGAATEEQDEASAERDDEPSEEERTMARELRDLAQAWADGGGTFGYPFWEKAGQRWRTGELTTSMYREYVTGYRDRLIVGCKLLDGVDTSTETADDVRELLIDSCKRRVDALRSEQRSLDERIRREAGNAAEEDATALDERIAELDAEAHGALQESWRDARRAMDQAQAALDEAGIDRLAEDAFI